MKQTMIQKLLQRASTKVRAFTLIFLMLATASAWADTGNEADGVYYIDATGTQKNTATDGIDGNDTPTVINNGNKPSSLTSGWYVVTGTVSYTSTVTLTGDVHLILADGCTMDVGTSKNRINGKGIYGNSNHSYHDLTIYGQAAGTGVLSVYTNGDDNYGIIAKNLTINGGNITANTNGYMAYAIYACDYQACSLTINGGTVEATTTGSYAVALFAEEANITIKGGTVEATSAESFAISGNKFIYTGGNVNATSPNGYAIDAYQYNFTWSNPTDCITIGSSGLYVDNEDPYTATFSKAMTNGLGNIYSTTLNNEGITALNTLAASNDGLTLYPYEENIAPTANAVDDNYWTTFYCGHTGYKIDDAENACAYTATYSSSTLTLHKLGKVIPAGTAVILVGEDNEISMTASTDAAENSVSNDLHGVDVRTATADIKSTLGDGTFYVLSKKNDVLGFYEYTADYMPARKAYLLINGGAALAKGLTMVFEDERTRITTTNYTNYTNSDEWYTINGVKLTGKPTTKGLYIHNGRKEVVK